MAAQLLQLRKLSQFLQGDILAVAHLIAREQRWLRLHIGSTPLAIMVKTDVDLLGHGLLRQLEAVDTDEWCRATLLDRFLVISVIAVAATQALTGKTSVPTPRQALTQWLRMSFGMIISTEGLDVCKH